MREPKKTNHEKQERHERLIRRALAVFVFFVPFVVGLLSPPPADARRRSIVTQASPATGSEQEVLRDFELILDLWRDGRYNELFERTATSRQSKEQFARALASAPRRPACCWEKMQDVRVSVTSERAAVVRARLGFDRSVPGTEFITRGIKLKKEDGVWMITQSELYSLAELKKKRSSYKYLPAQGK
ncbi:MAG TPA: hypothetical protein VJ604_00350 [Geomonas sp.]|nr:hypothetical protein [Geomonas sp.]